MNNSAAWVRELTKIDSARAKSSRTQAFPRVPFGGYRVQACKCDHVSGDDMNRWHCVQSWEYIVTTQTEGWAQFYATRLFNNQTEGAGKFVYYKEFLFAYPDWWVALPPIAFNAYYNATWMLARADDSRRSRTRPSRRRHRAHGLSSYLSGAILVRHRGPGLGRPGSIRSELLQRHHDHRHVRRAGRQRGKGRYALCPGRRDQHAPGAL
jgi:hypothetical protein